MQRRSFLRQAVLTTMGATAAATLPISAQTWVARAAQPTGKRMIVVFLRGAVDGLSVLVPYGAPEYYQVRSNITIAKPGAERGAYDLDGYFGLHPALAGVMPLWEAGKLGFVTASGLSIVNRSHFDAQDFLETATPGIKTTADGWMNRLLGTIREANPIQAINVGNTTPRIFAGKQPIASIAPGKQATRKLATDREAISDAFAELYKDQGRLGRSYREGQESRAAILDNLKQEMQQADNGAPPAAGFPTDAKRVAQAMLRDSRIELAFMSIGGWDTHINQGNAQGQLANNLKLLGQGVSLLAQELGAAFEETVILVMSEFGRTVKENGNRGTDHGRGNVMWVLGGQVRGQKIYGEWKGLATADLEDGRDVAVTTDFRSVLAEVLGQHWGLDDRRLEMVLPGFQGERSLGLFVG
jgi:uncharacterized protein (DUF1501 family)